MECCLPKGYVHQAGFLGWRVGSARSGSSGGSGTSGNIGGSQVDKRNMGSGSTLQSVDSTKFAPEAPQIWILGLWSMSLTLKDSVLIASMV